MIRSGVGLVDAGTGRSRSGAARRSARRARPRSRGRTSPTTRAGRAREPSVVPSSVELVDVHRAHRHLDRDAAAVQRIRALAVDLHGRRRRDREVDRARAAVERRASSSAVGGSCSSIRSPRGRRSTCAQRSISVTYRFVRPTKRLQPGRRRPRGAAGARSRRDRAFPRAPCAPRPRRIAATMSNDVGPGRLVDEDDPARACARGGGHSRPRRPTWAVTSRTMKSVISSTERSLEKPAASRCPPPATSARSRSRRPRRPTSAARPSVPDRPRAAARG